MKVTRKDLDKLNAVLTLTIEPADYQEKTEKELKDIRRKANIPGFRKGMVPISLVKKMYGKSVLADVINKTLGEGIYDYIRNEKLNILGEPLPNEDVKREFDWDNPTDFVFDFDIALAPEFDARLTEKDTLTYHEIEITDKMVDDQVTSYAERFGHSEDVEQYTDGDFIRGTLTEQTEGGIVVDKAMLMPSYMKDENQRKLFEGAKKGDVVTFNPSVAYDNDAEVASMLQIEKDKVAEHKGEFALTINSISHHQAAALDAELFAKVFADKAPADIDGFRALVREEMQQTLKQDQDYKFGKDAKEAILKKVGQLEFPDEFLKRWLQVNDKDMTEEKLEKEYPQMLEQLTWQLVVDQLAETYNIKVEQADLTAYAKNIARMQLMQYGLSHVEDNYLEQYAQEILKNENQARGIYSRVQEDKIFEAVKGVVKLKTKKVSYEDFGKEL